MLENFWTRLGCSVRLMAPAEHDRILANVSHLPHIAAASLVNATSTSHINFAGKGFLDTTRVASGPANVWTDVLMSNTQNITSGLDRLIAELQKFKEAAQSSNRKQIKKMLDKARNKRAGLIEYKIKQKEII